MGTTCASFGLKDNSVRILGCYPVRMSSFIALSFACKPLLYVYLNSRRINYKLLFDLLSFVPNEQAAPSIREHFHPFLLNSCFSQLFLRDPEGSLLGKDITDGATVLRTKDGPRVEPFSLLTVPPARLLSTPTSRANHTTLVPYITRS